MYLCANDQFLSKNRDKRHVIGYTEKIIQLLKKKTMYSVFDSKPACV